MNGNEFLRKLRKLGKARGVTVRYENTRGTGKGSHGSLFYGDKRTTLKDPKKEIGEGLLTAMLKQLGLSKKDL